MPAAVNSAPIDAMDLQQCLPIPLRLPETLITRIAAGMSGAGVYRIDAGNKLSVLKITPRDEPILTWRIKMQVQQSAADAGIAPQLIHVDESRRAVLSDLIVDKSFPALLGNPVTREGAIVALGKMLRRLHDLPIPDGLQPADAIGVLNTIWNSVPSGFVLPLFVRQAVEELRATPVAGTGALMMSHNDVNPTNLVFDGERVMLLDWQTIAPNDPYYDLAAIAMFFRLDDGACRTLIAAHDDAPAEVIPGAITYYRRFAAVLSGVAALQMAGLRGHAGGDVAADETLSLGDVYQRMRSGTFDIGSVSGQWVFGLALVKEGAVVG